jgi:DNA-binding CsgD family transcriptional regulator
MKKKNEQTLFIYSSGEQRLTPREEQVMELLSNDINRKTIAAMMNITPNTLKTYMKSIHLKTGTHSDVSLMRWVNAHRITAKQLI